MNQQPTTLRAAAAPSSSEIDAQIAEHVLSAAMPCPYARLPAEYVRLTADTDAEGARDQIAGALSMFWGDPRVSALVMLPPEQPGCHDEAREQAYLLRSRIQYLHLEARGAVGDDPAGVAARLDDQHRAWAADTPSFIGPRAVMGDLDIMVTAFNHHYPAGHPRWSPGAAFVVIRTRDLADSHEKRPDLAMEIAVHAKCKLLDSMLADRSTTTVDAMRAEYPTWVRALVVFRDFVTGPYTHAHRIDPQTLPGLGQARRAVHEAMSSPGFARALHAIRTGILASPDLPELARVLRANPRITTFDVAKVVYGDVAGMYVPPVH